VVVVVVVVVVCVRSALFELDGLVRIDLYDFPFDSDSTAFEMFDVDIRFL